MGCSPSRVSPTAAVAAEGGLPPLLARSSATIDKSLRVEAEESRRVIKCLLLGTGECGKSTILKQMKILHGSGFNSEEERESFRLLIVRNALDSVLSLCQAVFALNIPWESNAQRGEASEVISFVRAFLYSSSHLRLSQASQRTTGPSSSERRSLSLSSPHPPPLLLHTSSTDSPSYDIAALALTGSVPPAIQSLISSLFHCTPLQRAMLRSNEFNLPDSAHYFLSQSSTIFSPAYCPTTADILRSRLPTTGVIEASFRVDRLQFRMYDVGGQRGERKKWIHCFDAVTAILFVASLSEYDQVLSEERTRNRMKESLDLFEGINQLPWFRHIPIILFLNKADQFATKVRQVDIGTYFPHYTGGNDHAQGLRFIQDEFLRRNTNPDKSIYCHVTSALSTSNIEFVWKATRQIILEQTLQRTGMLM